LPCAERAAIADPLETICDIWARETAGRLPEAYASEYARDDILRSRIVGGWRDLCAFAEREGTPPEALFRRLVARAAGSSFLRGARTGYVLTLAEFFGRTNAGERKWRRIAAGCYDDPPVAVNGPTFVKGQVSLEDIRWVAAG
jgi:hypothetical protein